MRDPAARVFESHDPPAKAVACADDVVRLRPYVEAVDADRALAWYQDPEVLAGSEGPGTPPFDRERVLRMYRFLESIGELFMIEVRSDSGWVLVGDVTLAPETLPIVIGEKAYRHQGVATRVLTLLIQRAKERGLSSLQAKHIWIENVASRRLFARAGFEEVEVGTTPRAVRSYACASPCRPRTRPQGPTRTRDRTAPYQVVLQTEAGRDRNPAPSSAWKPCSAASSP